MPEVIPGFLGRVSLGIPRFVFRTHRKHSYVLCCAMLCVIYLLTVTVCRFQGEDGEVKYVREAEELIRPERNTLLVSFTDLEGFNQELATTIQEEFYR